MASLADTLELMLPGVPEELVGAETRPALCALARGLAPVHYCGFEVRLGESGEVDLQQCFSSRNGAISGLPERLLELTRRDGMRAGVWLELDGPAGSPSWLLGFERTASRAERLELARAVGLSAAAVRCFEACPAGADVAHIGLMVRDPSPYVRLQVMPVEPEELGAYLRAVGWEHDPAEAVEVARALRPHADRLALCLDVAEEVGRRLGFEAAVDRSPSDDERWPALLGFLVDRGLCTPAKRDALLAWPRVVTPADVPWAAGLAAASLLRAADTFSSLERRLSHVKVVLEPGVPAHAKAYFGYEHRWRRPALAEPEVTKTTGVRRRGRGRDDAVAAAISFLLASRDRSGCWHEFSGALGDCDGWRSMAGGSDEWATAFVAVALAGTGTRDAVAAARRAWTVLAERRLPAAGWGYNRLLPVDADSTSWTLRLAGVTGAAGSRPAQAARGVVADHRLADGGVSSYTPASCPRPGDERLASPDGSYAGWCERSHACVTAATALTGDLHALAFLRGAQRAGGSWRSYWWSGDEYATAFAAEALAATGRDDDRGRVERAAEWAAARIGPDGSVGSSPFATALAIRTMQQAPGAAPAPFLSIALAWLAAEQEDDGGWRASAALVSPRPDLADRELGLVAPITVLDDGRTFATAVALAALAGSVAS
jgi:hypothetical protein